MEALLGGPRDIVGEGLARLAGQFGQQPGQVAFQGLWPLAARKQT